MLSWTKTGMTSKPDFKQYQPLESVLLPDRLRQGPMTLTKLMRSRKLVPYLATGLIPVQKIFIYLKMLLTLLVSIIKTSAGC